MPKEGPFVRALTVHVMSMLIIPKNCTDPLGRLKKAFSPSVLKETAESAEKWVRDAIGAVKASPDNPYGDDDEAIALEIMRKVNVKASE